MGGCLDKQESKKTEEMKHHSVLTRNTTSLENKESRLLSDQDTLLNAIKSKLELYIRFATKNPAMSRKLQREIIKLGRKYLKSTKDLNKTRSELRDNENAQLLLETSTQSMSDVNDKETEAAFNYVNKNTSGLVHTEMKIDKRGKKISVAAEMIRDSNSETVEEIEQNDAQLFEMLLKQFQNDKETEFIDEHLERLPFSRNHIPIITHNPSVKTISNVISTLDNKNKRKGDDDDDKNSGESISLLNPRDSQPQRMHIDEEDNSAEG